MVQLEFSAQCTAHYATATDQQDEDGTYRFRLIRRISLLQAFPQISHRSLYFHDLKRLLNQAIILGLEAAEAKPSLLH